MVGVNFHFSEYFTLMTLIMVLIWFNQIQNSLPTNQGWWQQSFFTQNSVVQNHQIFDNMQNRPSWNRRQFNICTCNWLNEFKSQKYMQSIQNMFFSSNSKYAKNIYSLLQNPFSSERKYMMKKQLLYRTDAHTCMYIHKYVLVQRTDTRQSHDREHSGEAGKGTLEPPRG